MDDMRTGFLKKIGTAGSVLILVLSAIGIYMSYTVDLGVPERYISRHDTAYYAQSSETMSELLEELRENVFPLIEGITESFISPDSGLIVIRAERASFDRVKALILRDFNESLFEFR